MVVLLLAVFLGLIWIAKKTCGTVYNGFFFVMGPYVFIILIDNLLFKNMGFNPVRDKAISVYLMTMLLFFVGSSIGTLLASNIKTDFKIYRLSDINAGTLRAVCIFSEVFVMLDILLHIARYGISRFVSGEDSTNRSSISAHLTLLIIVLCVLLFDYYLENRHKIDLFLLLAAFGIIFSSFKKYHIISTLLIIFIYISVRWPKYIKKLGIVTLTLIVFFFMTNYVLNFLATNVTGVPKDFYMNHLWGYIAGGVLNLDAALDYFGTQSYHLSLGAWIIQMITAFPSLITNKLFGFTFTDYTFYLRVPFFSLGGDNISNVLCIPAAACVQGNAASYSLFSVFFGAVVEYAFIRAKTNQSVRSLLTASIFLSFCMLSFFASFFELIGPWEEMIIASLIVPILSIRIFAK